MMARLFIVGTFLLFSYPAFSDSIYVLGSYLSPNGRSDIFEQNRTETTFDTDDLNDFGTTFGYDHFIGKYLNVGGSVTYYQEDAGGRDRAFARPGGGPAERNFRLKLIPLEFNARALPVGRDVPVIPYIGGGVGLYLWEYEEAGDFVIDRNAGPRIISDRASSDGRALGFNLHGGIQIPFSRSAALIVEVKHLYVNDDLDDDLFDRFEPIDLSSIIYSAGISFSF